MRYLLTISFLILTIQVFGQTKTELIYAIKKNNILENEDKGLVVYIPEREKVKLPSDDNFENFKALVLLIDSTELVNLATDENPIIRMFAIRELFQQKNKTFDFKQAFMREFEKKVLITNHQGCRITREFTWLILFNDFSGNWNSTSYLKQTKDFEFVDNILKEIDLFCLSANLDLPSWHTEHILKTISGRQKLRELDTNKK